jgi:DNA-binding transcriptional LysR family regulator
VGFLVACNDQPDPNVETDTTGKAELLCDASLFSFLTPTFAMFDSAYPQASVRVKPASAREAMSQLFSGKTRGIIIAREYLPDEDSLMNVFKVPRHLSITIAQDALVFYTRPEFPLDTIAIEQLQQVFSEPAARLTAMFPTLKIEPTIICADANSSEYGNVMRLLAKNKPPFHLSTRTTSDSVLLAVEKHDNAIGVGYLSQLAGKANIKSIKLLKIGFTDSTGVRIRPTTVHQAYVVMGKYPFPVPLRVLLLEDRRNLPWGFGTFLRHDKSPKEYFLKSGIVPENARFNLVQEEDG